MIKDLCRKIFWLVMGIFGVITCVLCIWMLMINITVKRSPDEVKRLSSGHSPIIGLAAGALMTGTGIAGCVLNIRKRKATLALNIMVALALTVACFAIAVKDHIETEDELHLQPTNLVEAYKRLLNRWKMLGACSGLDSVIETTGLIIVLAAQRERSSGNVMQMNKNVVNYS